MWWFWGALGAFVFGINALIFALWDDGGKPSTRHRATAEFIAALITGAIFAHAFTPTLHSVAQAWIDADGVAVALTIGWSANYLWPRLLRKLGERVDSFGRRGPSQ